MIENRRKKILKKKKVLWAHDDIILNAILFFCSNLEYTENNPIFFIYGAGVDFFLLPEQIKIQPTFQ